MCVECSVDVYIKDIHVVSVETFTTHKTFPLINVESTQRQELTTLCTCVLFVDFVCVFI